MTARFDVSDIISNQYTGCPSLDDQEFEFIENILKVYINIGYKDL